MPEDTPVESADEIAPEGAAPVEAPEVETPGGESGADLDAIGAEAEEPDPWAEPPALADGVETFTRDEVEALRAQAEDYRNRAKELHDQYGEVDPNDLADAQRLLADLQTEEGAVQVMLDAAKSLNVPVPEVLKLFGLNAEEQAEVMSAEDDDEIVTMKQLREAVAEARSQTVQEREEEHVAAANRAANQAVHATFAALDVTDETERQLVIPLAEKHLEGVAGIPSPEQVEEAVRQGYADLQKAIERKAAVYVAGKKQQKAAVPKTLGRGAGAAAEPDDTPPPKNVAEAIARRREKERQAS